MICRSRRPAGTAPESALSVRAAAALGRGYALPSIRNRQSSIDNPKCISAPSAHSLVTCVTDPCALSVIPCIHGEVAAPLMTEPGRESRWFWATLVLSCISIVAIVMAFWELVENHFFRDLDYISL